jgi:hypothetical protein
MNIHYAVQVCDIANNQTDERYCNTDRTTLSIKSISSFLESVEYVTNLQKSSFIKHHITFFDDNSSFRLKIFLKKVALFFSKENIIINIVELKQHGIMHSIGTCYEYLRNEGTDIVYQVQDDYLYEKTCIYEMIDIFMKIRFETNTDSFIYPYNCATIWNGSYKNTQTPRVLFYGEKRHWIQIYDISCCFMTSVNELRQNRELTDLFLSLPPKGIEGNLESISLNYLFTKKGKLGISPLLSAALHVQLERNKDPYVDWKKLWDSIKNYE